MTHSLPASKAKGKEAEDTIKTMNLADKVKDEEKEEGKSKI